MPMKSCQENLTKIDYAKEQWKLETGAKDGDMVRIEDIVSADRSMDGYLKKFPNEPSGGSYVVNLIGRDPHCTTGYPGHSLSEVGLSIGIAITEIEQ